MQEQQSTSPIIGRIITVCGLVSLVAIIVFFVVRWRIVNTSGEMEYVTVKWERETFDFASGVRCHVFPEQKLAFFLGDGGDDEFFDNIKSRSFHTSMLKTSSGLSGSVTSSAKSGGGETFSDQTGKMTYFLDDKHLMVFSEGGTKLTLPDGREFTLDGKTPLWLRCKSDGTIDRLDELPKGFVDFFESPPPEPGLLGKVTSYPGAFQEQNDCPAL